MSLSQRAQHALQRIDGLELMQALGKIFFRIFSRRIERGDVAVTKARQENRTGVPFKRSQLAVKIHESEVFAETFCFIVGFVIPGQHP